MSRVQIPFKRGVRFPLWFLLAGLAGTSVMADSGHHHDSAPSLNPPGPFVASTAKSFAILMDESMAIMNYGMSHAPMGGDADRDFVMMMIPHHQGAVDMAKALLLYGKDPELRNLAQQIVTDQQNEINIMTAWLQYHPAGKSSKPEHP
jgi:uncharacterized protein (DUF305 family)